jgi:hypothetical protein
MQRLHKMTRGQGWVLDCQQQAGPYQNEHVALIKPEHPLPDCPSQPNKKETH